MLVRHATPRSLPRLLALKPTLSPPRRCLTAEAGFGDVTPNTPLPEVAADGLPTAAETHPVAATSRARGRRIDTQDFDPRILSHLTGQHMRKKSGRYGTEPASFYQPSSLMSNPPGPKDVTLELLLASQSHLGHSVSLWNPANSRYIFGIRAGIHIISLEATAQMLRRAAKVVSGVASRAGLILFVGTRQNFDLCVVKAAELAAPACHLFDRWIPGSITNRQQILGKCGKKVVDEFDADVAGFEESVLDRAALRPDLVVCLNPMENQVLLHECALEGIPTVGIIDTDANPAWVTYPIPANDDSLRCVEVIAGVLGRAGQEGQQKRREATAQGDIPHGRDASLTLPSKFDYQRYLAKSEEARAEHENGGHAPTATRLREAVSTGAGDSP